jgi:hypothetical protein
MVGVRHPLSFDICGGCDELSAFMADIQKKKKKGPQVGHITGIYFYAIALSYQGFYGVMMIHTLQKESRTHQTPTISSPVCAGIRLSIGP